MPVGSEAQASSASRAPSPEIAARTLAVDRTSSADGSPRSSLRPSAVAARISQRWATDLSPGTRARPPIDPPGRIVTRTLDASSSQPDGLEPPLAERPLGLVGAPRRHGEIHGAASALRRVDDLEVLDVDADR